MRIRKGVCCLGGLQRSQRKVRERVGQGVKCTRCPLYEGAVVRPDKRLMCSL